MKDEDVGQGLCRLPPQHHSSDYLVDRCPLLPMYLLAPANENQRKHSFQTAGSPYQFHTFRVASRAPKALFVLMPLIMTGMTEDNLV